MADRISVIVPIYQVAPWLCRCVESVLAQADIDLEVILVDDGSTDGSGAVADACAARDSRVKVIHQENGGVTSARLRGVAEATGDWIGFVDGDDYIEPDMYRQLLDNALRYDADISHCGYRMVFPNDRVDYYYNTGMRLIQEGNQGCLDLVSGEFVEPGLVNKLYRRELFRDIGERMDRTIRNNEDLLMNYYLFRQAERAIYEDFCPYHYILRHGSATTSRLNDHKLRDPLRVTRKILADAPEALYPVAYRRLVRQLISGATRDAASNPALIGPHRQETRRELRQRLGEILMKTWCSPRLKLMALWAAVWPDSYGFVHKIYSRITGVDRKYEL